MASKLNLVILFGGQSGEHEVSLSSAAFIIDSLRTCPDYKILPVGITRQGRWYAYSGPTEAMREGTWQQETWITPAILLPDAAKPFLFTQHQGRTVSYGVDCVFPVLHGLRGEDGTIQGMLEMAGIPYVGCGQAACALAMDKALAKALFQEAGIAQTGWRTLDRETWQAEGQAGLADRLAGLAYPLFVKPSRGGSSLGISRVASFEDLAPALDLAFQHDRKAIIEEGVVGRELEIAVLGDYLHPFLSPVGEIVPDRAFYDYDSKYEAASTSQLIIPAPLAADAEASLRQMALQAWGALNCYGLARIDFFMSQEGRLLLNEINTMPGFVRISMYPRLMRAAGYEDATLLRELIDLALARQEPM